MDTAGSMQVNGYTLPPKTLKHIEALIGEKRMYELQEIAHNICQTAAKTADERIVIAEFCRLYACVASWQEEGEEG